MNRCKDFLKRNARLALVHTIFSDKNKDNNNEWIVKPAVWSTQWKKKRDGFEHWGKTNAENLEAIYNDALFYLGRTTPEASKKILFLDNYSAHKRIRWELRGSSDEMIDWINSSEEEGVDEELVELVKELHSSAATKGMDVDRKELFKALREKGVATTALEALAKSYGVEIKYLPPYYSELNPIELLWAEVKRFYRDETSPTDEWHKRMEEAWNSITPAFIESCFDRSIRWALKKHKERKDAKDKLAAAAAEPAAQDVEDEHDEDDHQYEEILAEEEIDRMNEDIEDEL